MRPLFLFPIVFLASYSLGIAVGCSSAQVRTEDKLLDAAGKLCPVIVQATDPALDPLCVDYETFANVLESGLAKGQKPQDAVYAAVLAAQGKADAGVGK